MASEIGDFSTAITLVEYCYVLLIYAVALQYKLRILWALYRRVRRISFREKNGLSNLLIANIVCWTILLATALPHIAWMIANWRPTVRYVNAYVLYWSTIVTQCMMPVIPFSVFFLSLDRIFTIQWLTAYQERHKLALLAICVPSLLTVFGVNLVAYNQIMPLPEQTDCTVFACLMTNGNSGFIISKIIGAILIVSSGTYFLYKLHGIRTGTATNSSLVTGPEGTTTTTGMTTRHSKIEANTLVMMMLATEMGLNFLPQLIVLVIQQIVQHSIASSLGPHNLSLNATEALITALMYRHSLRRFIDAGSSSIQQQASNQQQQHRRVMPVNNKIRRVTVVASTAANAATPFERSTMAAHPTNGHQSTTMVTAVS